MSYKSNGEGYHNVLNTGGRINAHNTNDYIKDMGIQHESERSKDRRAVGQSAGKGMSASNQYTNKYSNNVDLTNIKNLSKNFKNYSDIKSTNCFDLSPVLYKSTTYGLPDIGDEYSLYRSRSVSVSSGSSANSTGTVCEGEIFPYGKGIAPQRKKRSTSPPSRNTTPKQTVLDNSVDNAKSSAIYNELDSRSTEKSVGTTGISNTASVKANWKNADAGWRKKLVETPDLLWDKVVSRKDIPIVKGSSRMQQRSNMEQEDDAQSVSTVSGSGIDFFRKFVQRKGTSCKDCEDQFRREVLIDRLVSDSLNTKAALGERRSKESSEASGQYFSGSEMSRPMSEMSDNDSMSSFNHSLIVSSLGEQDMEQKARGCASRCNTHRHANQATPCEDTQSISTKSSVSSSSISGSGLLFLRNYLKKKKSKSRAMNPDGSAQKSDPKDISAFNIVPVPFPPPSDFYGPAFMQDGGPDNMSDTSSDRRLSVCSTVADLLNEDFDCDDSELKNLDWEEWDEPLPDDISYDDLVSVISESFYSDDLDLADLCELDWEGRQTVVANDRQVLTPDDRNKTVQIESPDKSAEKEAIHVLGEPSKYSEKSRSSKDSTVDSETNESSKSRYGSFKSSTFMQDLEAELELPPMTPVSDEKEEAVRALSRTISQYMRTGSNSSYTTDPGRLSRQSTHNEQGRYSRKSTHEELERNSRMSVYSPAMSDYLPELASSSASPAPFRRPLSQLLTYDVPTSSPQYQETTAPSPDVIKKEDAYNRQNLSSGQKLPIWGAQNCNSSPNPNNSHKEVLPVPGQMSNILNLPSSVYSLTPEGKSQDSSPNNIDTELAGHNSSPFELRNKASGSKTPKNSNRDSLLCTNYPYTPPLCSSPSVYSQCAPTTRIPYLRHSSSNSTDSGCPLLDDKIASLSPTPSPRTNIEVLSRNRNKLASFWEKSVTTSASGGGDSDISLLWVPSKENSEDSTTKQQGFQPFRSAFGSENSLAVNDRLAHFQDMTRRAAERNTRGGRNMHRAHRASTGSDCSDFLDKITLSPAQTRRRESFTEYFV
eukprot:GFUD01000632.1.p1 GENE.GFUD01000632.1~~GFUD01000632.1.p1  ORF type:complete len:1047 (+),score=168.00 GFUD01000632.1:1591-4731(+)